MPNPPNYTRPDRIPDLALLAGLAAAAGAGSLVHLPMAYGLDLVFGSIFAMLAIKWLGTGAGVLVAAVGGANTIVLWHHPYAWLIILAEALSVGLLRRYLRPRGEVLPLAALDGLYWVFLGMPLVALCYGGPLAMSTTEVLLVAFKQAINGVLNAALAGALAIGLLGLRRRPAAVSFSDFLFVTLVLAVLTPSLGVSIWQNQRLNEAMELGVADTLTLALGLSTADFAAADPPPTLAAARDALPTLVTRITQLMPQAQGLQLTIEAPDADAGPDQAEPRPLTGLRFHLARRPGYSRMERWRQGHYQLQAPLTLDGTPVQLVAEFAATRPVQTLQEVQLGVFWRLGLITLLALSGAFFISRRVGRPIAALAEAAGHLPGRLDHADPTPPPRPSRLRETAELAAAFARMESALRENFTALAQSEARFRAVFEQAPLGMAIVGPDRRPRFVNPALERLLGRDAAAIKALRFEEVTHPEDIDTDVGLFQELVAGRRDSYQMTKRYLRPDGTLVWGELSVTLLPEPRGGPPIPLGLVQDITQRCHAQEARALAELALQDYSAKLEAFCRLGTRYQPPDQDLAELLRFGCACIGVELAALAEVRDGRYRLIAAVGRLAMGPTREVPLDGPIDLDQPCRTEPEPQGVHHPALGTGLRFLARVVLHWSDAEGLPHHGVLDLADRRRSPACGQPEQQILQLVASRIGANLREQAVVGGLLQSRQREVIGHLAGGVAHDFNNVLGAIGNNLQYLRRLLPVDSGGTAAREVLDETQAAIGQAKVVTSGLLSLGRGEDRSVVPCDLGALVEAFAPLVSRLLPPDIELVLALEPGVRALVNPALLQAALLNLALNSRDAMGARGRLTLSVAARAGPDPEPPDLGDAGPGERAELGVRDTGAGMTEAVRRRIFEPLFSTKSHGRGTGLGLFMVREFALRSHGAIQVRSVPGAGTCFRLWLPRTDRPAAAQPPNTAAPAPVPRLPEAARPQPAGPPTGAQILVVDDDQRVRNALSRVLAAAGYQVFTTSDGADALDRLAAEPAVALVLSDIAMPRLDGLALYGALCCERPQLPVILMTGDPAGAADAAAMDPTARVLRKPLDNRALVELIRTVLGG